MRLPSRTFLHNMGVASILAGAILLVLAEIRATLGRVL